MWEAADGKSMGRQKIYDQRLNISTEWFNRENSWLSQVKIARNDSVSTGLVFYFSLQVSFFNIDFKLIRFVGRSTFDATGF